MLAATATTVQTQALTVTYLVPVFGSLWGALFLDEHISAHMVVGAVMIVGGIAVLARSRRK